MTPIRHKNCGAIVFWYIGDRHESRQLSRDVLKLDGTRPEHGSSMGKCPTCNGELHGSGLIPTNIYRSFDEDLEPEFKLETI